MTIHYKNKNHYRYPKTACGVLNLRHEHSDMIKNVTCRNCLKYAHREHENARPMSMGDHERNQLEFRRNGITKRLR